MYLTELPTSRRKLPIASMSTQHCLRKHLPPCWILLIYAHGVLSRPAERQHTKEIRKDKGSWLVWPQKWQNLYNRDGMKTKNAFVLRFPGKNLAKDMKILNFQPYEGLSSSEPCKRTLKSWSSSHMKYFPGHNLAKNAKILNFRPYKPISWYFNCAQPGKEKQIAKCWALYNSFGWPTMAKTRRKDDDDDNDHHNNNNNSKMCTEHAEDIRDQCDHWGVKWKDDKDGGWRGCPDGWWIVFALFAPGVPLFLFVFILIIVFAGPWAPKNSWKDKLISSTHSISTKGLGPAWPELLF